MDELKETLKLHDKLSEEQKNEVVELMIALNEKLKNKNPVIYAERKPEHIQRWLRKTRMMNNFQTILHRNIQTLILHHSILLIKEISDTSDRDTSILSVKKWEILCFFRFCFNFRLLIEFIENEKYDTTYCKISCKFT